MCSLQEVERLIQGIHDGDRRSIARALTLVDGGDTGTVRRLLEGVYPHTGRASIIGITGPPGVGKSTLTNGIVTELRRSGRTVGVLALDPSSPFSGGALLGDRLRMIAQAEDRGVLIRSMSSRGQLGGLSIATPAAVMVLDASGFDEIILETVGVGQSEVEVAFVADTVVLALAPGMGDSVQAAKAGIIEVADAFVVNKSDRPGAGKLESELRAVLAEGHAIGGHSEWWPPIVRTVAVRHEGVPETVQSLRAHRRHLSRSGLMESRLRRRIDRTVRSVATAQLHERFVVESQTNRAFGELVDRAAAKEISPYEAADHAVRAFRTTDRRKSRHR